MVNCWDLWLFKEILLYPKDVHISLFWKKKKIHTPLQAENLCFIQKIKETNNKKKKDKSTTDLQFMTC